MEKNERNLDRARQFMPFAALRGFEELIREQSQEPVARRILTEEAAARLSEKLLSVSCGMMVQVTYYDGRTYRTVVGLVSDIDFAGRRLRVVKTEICFDDIDEIRAEKTEP